MMICAEDWPPDCVSLLREWLTKSLPLNGNNTNTHIHTSAHAEKSFVHVMTYGLCFLFRRGVLFHKPNPGCSAFGTHHNTLLGHLETVQELFTDRCHCHLYQVPGLCLHFFSDILHPESHLPFIFHISFLFLLRLKDWNCSLSAINWHQLSYVNSYQLDQSSELL